MTDVGSGFSRTFLAFAVHYTLHAFPQRTRLRSFDYIGMHRYSLTFCTDNRRPLFVTRDLVTALTMQIAQYASAHEFAVFAYCFMPDHLHLLLAGESETADAKRVIRAIKQQTGYWYSRTHADRLWQRYSWDRVLRADEDTWVVIRYILANPVRAGLVQNALDYPFSGSIRFTRQELVDAFFADQSG